MRTRATLAVGIVTRVTRVTHVDIPKTLYVFFFRVRVCLSMYTSICRSAGAYS